MTNEEAIKHLEDMKKGLFLWDMTELIDLCISALSENKGEWLHHKSTLTNVEDSRECSKCHVWLNWDMPRNSFCPNCGADMRGEG